MADLGSEKTKHIEPGVHILENENQSSLTWNSVLEKDMASAVSDLGSKLRKCNEEGTRMTIEEQMEDLIEESVVDNIINTDCECIIHSLLKLPFYARPTEEKKKIVEEGRPKPDLSHIREVRVNSKCRNFQNSIYNKVEWVAGCSQKCKLFCWACIMFFPVDSVWRKPSWTSSGFFNLKNMIESTAIHETSKAHLHCALKLKLFENENLKLTHDSNPKTDMIEYNRNVKRNRVVLKRLIDVFCFVNEQNTPETAGSFQGGSCIDLLSLLSKCDSTLATYLEQPSGMIGLSQKVQIDVRESIAEVLIDVIKKEVKAAVFLTGLLYEVLYASGRRQLFVILKLTTNELDDRERFIGIVDVSANHSVDSLVKQLFSCFAEYDCREKLVSLMYVGALAASDKIKELETHMNRNFPKVMFTYCASHALNFTLTKILSNIKECKIFFSMISNIENLLMQSLNRNSAISKFVDGVLTRETLFKGHRDSKFTKTLVEHSTELQAICQDILKNEDTHDGDMIVVARNLLLCLEDFDFLFMLLIFSAVFPLTETLSQFLQMNVYDITHSIQKVFETDTALKVIQGSFNTIWSKVKILIGAEARERRDKSEDTYKALHHNVFNTIHVYMDRLIHDLKRISFVELLKSSSCDVESGVLPVAKLYNSLLSTHGHLFEARRLRNELYTVYKSDQLPVEDYKGLLRYITSQNLVGLFPQLFRLCHLVLVLPAVERSLSSSSRVTRYIKSTIAQGNQNKVAVIFMESELLKEVRQDKGFRFYARTIEIFKNKNKSFNVE